MPRHTMTLMDKPIFGGGWVLLCAWMISACGGPKGELPPGFVLSDARQATTFYYDADSEPLVLWALEELANDIEAISGVRPDAKATSVLDASKPGIYVGQQGHTLLSHMAELDAELKGEWEHYAILNQGHSVVVAGSDVRGTVYGIFEIARQIGISPWAWWADVPMPSQSLLTLRVPDEGWRAGPSVQYRGIFLNDEDWGLQPWAAKTFEPEVGDIGPKTYEKIFQLLLRLRANTIWPAMHPSTVAFYQIPGNREMAARYHIVVGTSHAEPMMRNNVDEWQKDGEGEYNYFTNKDIVERYWEQRIAELSDPQNQFMVTMGMRGIHDGAMVGPRDTSQRVAAMETIIQSQRQMLTRNLELPLEQIPHVLIPYKEVLELYNAGMAVPDDVTLMWTEDNYGYIRRLSDKREQARSGGSGVYYHISYWGRPHDYLWLDSTQPGLIWLEMMRAYQNDARKVWILNVGDIKPAEYATEFFLDMAWDINSIGHDGIQQHMQDWASREFGSEHAEAIAEIRSEYYRLAMLRKPEFMGWSQVEVPKAWNTPTGPTEFNPLANGNELQRRIDAYETLVEQVIALREQLDPKYHDAYYQLMEYPVRAAAAMNHKFLYADLTRAASDPAQRKHFGDKAEAAYHQIADLTDFYNVQMSDGKWQHMMDHQPRNLPAYRLPREHRTETLSHEAGLPGLPSPLFINADQYRDAHGQAGYQWARVGGLGYSDGAMALLPLDNHQFEGEQPTLDYQFDLSQAGEYELELRLLPTHANEWDHQVTVTLEGLTEHSERINTRGRSEEWKTNVLRNYQSVKVPFRVTQGGSQRLTVAVSHTGIVLDQLAVSPVGTAPYYEIPK